MVPAASPVRWAASRPACATRRPNLGNLVADAMRFAGNADVAVQNGGGIRTSVAAGDVTVGDTLNVLPFTNLVKHAPSVSAEQLKGS